jgi:alkanesulfonate monooxygenase SsuD/methylene tetrahydromethanopterin reductase-like flavin-dependent oxidoreductase (luciferase family)
VNACGVPPPPEGGLEEICEFAARTVDYYAAWEGKFRGPLTQATTLPRPFAGAPRVWHGSATTLTSAALAAKWGDPLFSANAIQPRANYKILIDHYRAEYDRHGYDPRYAYVAAGAGFLFLADTTRQAKEHYGPV